MHPFKRDDCVKLKEFDAEDNRAYFKVGMEDKLKRRNCPRSCTFCGRDFVGNKYELMTQPMELEHENDYLGGAIARRHLTAIVDSIQAAHERGDMDDYPNGM